MHKIAHLPIPLPTLMPVPPRALYLPKDLLESKNVVRSLVMPLRYHLWSINTRSTFD